MLFGEQAVEAAGERALGYPASLTTHYGEAEAVKRALMEIAKQEKEKGPWKEQTT